MSSGAFFAQMFRLFERKGRAFMDTGRDWIVITGASGGIGRATARLLAAQGFTVFAGVRREADGEAVRAGAPEYIRPLILDVTDQESVREAAGAVGAALGEGRLAGLVNNAGIAVAGPLELIALEDFERQLRVNVTGPLAVTQAFLPLLRRGRGRIVNMGSISGRFASPFLGPYSASKFALEALTDALRREVASQGIDVSIIEPGPVATPIWEKSRRAGREAALDASPEAEALYGQLRRAVMAYTAHSEQRAISPEAVAQTVLRALTATRPRTRYLIGRKIRWEALFARLMPDRLMDRLIADGLKKWDRPEP